MWARNAEPLNGCQAALGDRRGGRGTAVPKIGDSSKGHTTALCLLPHSAECVLTLPAKTLHMLLETRNFASVITFPGPQLGIIPSAPALYWSCSCKD